MNGIMTLRNPAPAVVHVDDSIAPLVPRYLARRADDAHAMRDALDSGDLMTARTIGHKMRGSGGGYGFDYLTDLGAEVEAAAVRGDLVTLRECVSALEEYLSHVRVEYVA
ncbi:MAG: Hpt domain-containing protein [Coriobacteriia bacterium]